MGAVLLVLVVDSHSLDSLYGHHQCLQFYGWINGITGGYSLVILAALAYINKEVVTFVEADFIYTVICSVLVFCFFNFRKRAKCFAGDVGSVSIAFILLFLIGRLIIETEDFSWIVLLSVYGVDSVLTIIHRLMLHENIGLPHRKHLYQIMANELKIPHVIVSLAYMTIQTLIIVGYIYCQRYGYIFLIGCILLLSAIYVLFMKKYFSDISLELLSSIIQFLQSPEYPKLWQYAQYHASLFLYCCRS